MPIPNLELQEGVWIRKLDNWELERLVEGGSSADIRAFGVEQHSFAAVYEERQDSRWAIEDQAESVVNCLRLLKPGRVAGAELVDVSYRRRRNLEGVWIHQGLAPKNVFNLEWHYELLREDREALCKLWQSYRCAVESGAHWFREAVFRLGESYERVTDEHKAVDLTIALECCVGKRDREEGKAKGERVLILIGGGRHESGMIRSRLRWPAPLFRPSVLYSLAEE